MIKALMANMVRLVDEIEDLMDQHFPGPEEQEA